MVRNGKIVEYQSQKHNFRLFYSKNRSLESSFHTTSCMVKSSSCDEIRLKTEKIMSNISRTTLY